MKHLLLPALALALAGTAFAIEYKAKDNDWVRLPDIKSQPVNQHGDVQISSKGEVYVSTMDPKAGIMVFSQDGKLLRSLEGVPNDFHGFVIRQRDGGEFIYGPRLNEQTIVKLTLDGKKILEIPASAIPDKYKTEIGATMKKGGKEVPNPDAGKRVLRMTGIDVAANGDIFVTDGYGQDYIHRFDKTGKYIKSFGGRKVTPYNFNSIHKIAIDTRFSPERIIALDRENRRILHLSLDGDILGIVASDMLRPSGVAIRGEYAAIAEISGRVTLLDKAGKAVVHFGTNSDTTQINHNKTEPAKWKPGLVNSPHGITFNEKGDIFVSEYSQFGRVHLFVLRK